MREQAREIPLEKQRKKIHLGLTRSRAVEYNIATTERTTVIKTERA
jgi:hypothetical protein